MKVNNISSAIAKEMYDMNVKFIDVREESEHEEVRIPNTKLIPMSEVHDRWNEIPNDEDVVIYCRTGHRSGVLITHLLNKGYTNLHNLEDGIVDWHINGFPIDRS